MRRIWAAGAVVFWCVLLGSVSATAQSPSAGANWAAVTGTSTCGLTTAGTLQSSPQPSLIGQVLTCFDMASDPRVSGRSTLVLNASTWDRAAHNAVAWIDPTLEGPAGTWVGHGYGLYDNAGVAHMVVIASGSGAYEGWTYVYSATVPANEATLDIVGLIYQGAPPPGFPVGPTASPAPSK
jgi:hypothetical protein